MSAGAFASSGPEQRTDRCPCPPVLVVPRTSPSRRSSPSASKTACAQAELTSCQRPTNQKSARPRRSSGRPSSCASAPRDGKRCGASRSIRLSNIWPRGCCSAGAETVRRQTDALSSASSRVIARRRPGSSIRGGAAVRRARAPVTAIAHAARRSAPGSVERERAQGLIGGRSVQQRPARRLHDTQARAATSDEEIHFVHSCERLI